MGFGSGLSKVMLCWERESIFQFCDARNFNLLSSFTIAPVRLPSKLALRLLLNRLVSAKLPLKTAITVILDLAKGVLVSCVVANARADEYRGVSPRFNDMIV